MQTVTEQLNKDQLVQEVKSFIEILKLSYKEKVTLYFDFDISIGDYWEPLEVEVNDIEKIFLESISNNKIDVGYSDFTVKGSDFELLMCNDSDLHFTTTNKDFHELVVSSWKDKGFETYFYNDR